MSSWMKEDGREAHSHRPLLPVPNTLPHRCRLLRRKVEQTLRTTFPSPCSFLLHQTPAPPLHVCLMGNLNKVSRQFICINMLSLCVFPLSLFVCCNCVCSVCVWRMFLYANLRAFCCRFVILSVCPFVALPLCSLH